MKQVLTASEIANLALPNLPKSRQGIEAKAKAEKWPFDQAIARGRNGSIKRYIVASLPSQIKALIQQKAAKNILAASEAKPLPSQGRQKKLTASKRLQQLGLPVEEYCQNLTDKQRDVAHARMSLCIEAIKMNEVAGLKIKEAVQYIIDQIERGTLPDHLMQLVNIANARKNNQRGLCFSSLYNWVLAFRKAKPTPDARLAAMSPKKTKPEKAILAYDFLPDFLRFYARPSAPAFAHAYRQFAKDWIDSGHDIAELPGVKQVRCVLNKMPAIARERGRKTGSEYKSLLPYIKRDWLALSPNDVWIGDGHSFKAKVSHPIHGRPFKPEVTVIIDCCRYVVGFAVSLAENTVAVADALRLSIKNNGLPLIYYSDNGGGQTGKHIDHEVTGYCARLGISHETGIPGNPQGRGIIEGFWEGTLINLAREYDTYTGRGMDSGTKNLMFRKMNSAFNALEKGKELTAEQQQYIRKLPKWNQFINDLAKCLDEYNNRPHRSLPKDENGQNYTPKAYRKIRIERDGIAINYLTDSELDTLFMPEEIRMTKRGLVSLFDKSYFSTELANFHGEQVRVAFDLHDFHHVIVREMSGKFICKAQFEGNKREAFPKTRMEQLRENRVKRSVQNKQQQINLAMAELNPVIEQQPDFSLLVGNGEVIAHAQQSEAKKPLFMFESEREEWERKHGKHA